MWQKSLQARPRPPPRLHHLRGTRGCRQHQKLAVQRPRQKQRPRQRPRQKLPVLRPRWSRALLTRMPHRKPLLLTRMPHSPLTLAHRRRRLNCSCHNGVRREIVCVEARPSPTLSPTDPLPRGLLTLCPGLHIYIYVCVCVCVCIYIYIYIYIYMWAVLRRASERPRLGLAVNEPCIDRSAPSGSQETGKQGGEEGARERTWRAVSGATVRRNQDSCFLSASCIPGPSAGSRTTGRWRAQVSSIALTSAPHTCAPTHACA